jgi:hypothetical protein
MGDYNLSALNTRDFEHLVQAIGKKVISPGLTPFGDGPDDGREATFDGPMDYPSSVASWKGYLVIQCKFHQRPQGTNPDGAWALKQLRDELKKYKENRVSRKPDYFIYATNVTLSAAKNGWKDKVRSTLRSLVDGGEIRGFDVWSYDELRTFLDDAESIRRAYAGFITGGDVLAEAIRLLGVDKTAPDFRDVMMSYLQKELRAEHAAKLESITQISVPPALSSIFIDLPVSIFPTGLDSAGDESEDSLFALHSLLEAGQEKLNNRRPKAPDGSFVDDNGDEVDFYFDFEPDLDRCILIGGPGQGKSTLGQVLCQIYRAKFLDTAPKARLDPTVASMVRQILEHVESMDLPPAVCRFPFRLVLNTFAVDLSKNPSLTVLEALRERIEKHAAKPITRDTLKEWLRSYPCVVIFDGLDEVPASSNRAQVLDAIHDFHIDVAGEQADIQFVATSRPQGYSEEFKQARYTHLYLRPLSTDQALSYGEKLVGARFPDDSDLRERVVRRLRVACENSSTQRLMRSPLQVTIMATLVERTGEAPRQRYRLFSDYYKTIFDREVSREGPLSRTMRDRQTIINVIHHRTGLLLQREAERTGSTEARLQESTFIELVRHLLITEIEEPEDKAVRLIEQLKESSIDRLVFLIKPEVGLISYELRSLQEFMAAEALYVAETNAVKARLRAIAAIPYWRNVLLFFVGRAFSEQNDSVVDFVLELCEELNEAETDDASSFSLSGSELALQIILDGVTDENPRRSRQFLKLALRQIEIPVADAMTGLIDAFRPEWEAQYRLAIESRIHNPNDLSR